MSNFKNIEKLGLSITTWGGDPRTSAVLAQELESLLQSAQVVYGLEEGGTFWWATHQLSQDTHQAILIAITPIKKKTKAEAALELLERLHSMPGIFNVAWPKEDMKRILEMKDEV